MRLSSGAYAAGALLDAVESGVRAKQVELQVSQTLGLSLDLGAFGAVDEELALVASTRTAVATGRDLLLEDDGDRYLLRLGAMLDEAEHMARALEALLISGSGEGRLPLERVVAIWARAAAFQTCFVAAALKSAEQAQNHELVKRYRTELADAQDDRRTAEDWVARVARRPDEDAWLEIFERARLLPRRLRTQVSEIDEVISLCRTYIRRKKRAAGETAPKPNVHREVIGVGQPRRSALRGAHKAESKRTSNPAVESFRDRRPRDERSEDAIPRSDLASTRPRRSSNPKLEPLITPKPMPAVTLKPVEVDPLVEELLDAMAVSPAALGECIAKAGPRLDAEILRQLVAKQQPMDKAGEPSFVEMIVRFTELLRKKARPRSRGCELAYQLLSEARRVVDEEAAPPLVVMLAAALLDRPSADRSEDAARALTLLQPLVDATPAPQTWLREAMPRIWTLAAEANLRIKGDRSALVETCLKLCERTLQTLGSDAKLLESALAHLLRGDALRERGRGKRAENLEEALAAYREGLGRLKKDEHASAWARGKLGAGLAYALRQTGEPKDNQIRAIENLNEAVGLLDESARDALAIGRLHLARLLQKRGNEADQVRIGELYDLAAKVLTMKDHPNEFQLCHDGIEQLRRPKRLS